MSAHELHIPKHQPYYRPIERRMVSKEIECSQLERAVAEASQGLKGMDLQEARDIAYTTYCMNNCAAYKICGYK